MNGLVKTQDKAFLYTSQLKNTFKKILQKIGLKN